MKISENHLRAWVNPKIDSQTLAEQLTFLGLEVETVTPIAEAFSGVIVAEVLSAEKHPNADRLRVCRVNAGEAEPLMIVCGAQNVRAGLKIALAKIGAVLPGNFQIKRSKIRDVESFGMICSAKELGLAEESEGILELASDAPVGTDFREYYDLDDQIFDVNVTANRGDCMSVLGLAREITAKNNLPLQKNIKPQVTETHSQIFPVEISAHQACPRYLGRVIKDVKLTQKSPFWLAEKLRRAGLRSINVVVDITNYVMLEIGQPLHAFDLAKLKENIHVRFAKTGEAIDLLNGEHKELTPDTLMIADAKDPLAIAGVMGGEFQSVTDETTDLFLESAFFSPEFMIGKARQYGLQTDSAQRFERGVDPNITRFALDFATQLLVELANGKAGPVIEKCDEQQLPKMPKITLQAERLKKYLGIAIEKNQVEKILSALNMQIETITSGWHVTAPSYRLDIKEEADLIEEILRFYGIENIPLHLPKTNIICQLPSEKQLSVSQLRTHFVERGYLEVVTYSFISPKLQELFGINSDSLTLANPISNELSVMRCSLIPGLVSTLLYNRDRQQTRVRLFEIGRSYSDNHATCATKSSADIREQTMIAGALFGPVVSQQWGSSERAIDFFDVKGDLESLFALTGEASSFVFERAEHSALHPGQSSHILRGGKVVGFIGALSPQIQHALDCEQTIYVFELFLEPLMSAKLPWATRISKYPAIRRDIAVLVEQVIPFSKIYAVIKVAGGAMTKDIVLFDVYAGKNIAAGQRSLALGITMQHEERTLTDEEVNQTMDAIRHTLTKEFGAILRE